MKIIYVFVVGESWHCQGCAVHNPGHVCRCGSRHGQVAGSRSKGKWSVGLVDATHVTVEQTLDVVAYCSLATWRSSKRLAFGEVA